MWERGFYGQEESDGVPARWTDGEAELRVPIDLTNPPKALEIRMRMVRSGERLFRLLVNDQVLFSGRIAEAWDRVFSLDGIPASRSDILKIQLQSDTFNPSLELSNSRDTRTLGVLVLGIRLLTDERVPPGAAVTR